MPQVCEGDVVKQQQKIGGRVCVNYRTHIPKPGHMGTVVKCSCPAAGGESSVTQSVGLG